MTNAAPASPFLALPGEVRNEIYQIIVSQAPQTVRFIKGHIFPPPISRVSRQVRKDFLSYWDEDQVDTSEVTLVRAVVFDFDFEALLPLLEGVWEKEDGITRAFVEVALVLTSASTVEIDRRTVRAWVLRMRSFPVKYRAILDPPDLSIRRRCPWDALWRELGHRPAAMLAAVDEALLVRAAATGESYDTSVDPAGPVKSHWDYIRLSRFGE